MKDDHTKKWLNDLRWNIKMYEYETAGKFKGIYNQSVEMDTEAIPYKNAEFFTDDCTFEQFIEQLASIEI